MSSVPQSSALPTRSFEITISVRGDISEECIQACVDHFKRATDYCHVVTELGEKHRLHLHGVLLYKKNRLWQDIQDNVWQRQVRPYHPDNIPKVAVKVHVCPDNDWYYNYLKKESEVTLRYSNYDPEAALDYFPSQEVQEALMATHKRKGFACAWLEHDIETWSGSTYENTPVGALMYLKYRMFVVKNMVPIADKRKLTEKALMYWEYRNQVVSPSEREQFLLKQLQDGPAFDVPGSIRGASSAAPPSI